MQRYRLSSLAKPGRAIVEFGVQKGRLPVTRDVERKSSRSLDPDKYVQPRQFSDEEVETAINHIKTNNPRLWSELVSLERQKVAIDPVWPALGRLLNETKLLDRPAELADLIMAVRRVAVAEAARQ